MATYNGEKYIHEQIDSILKQTCQDFELIICDDCSTDSTWDIVQEYEKLERRIHCYLNEINLGYKNNFEKAIKLCVGEYIALSDQDDIWTDDHLDILFNAITGYQVCCGNIVLINEDGKYLGKIADYLGDFSLLNTDYLKLQRMLYGRSPLQGASMLIHRSILQCAIPIPDNISHDTWFFFLSCIQHTFIYSNKVVNHYRQHNHNTSGNIKIGITVVVNGLLHYKKKQSDRLHHCYGLLERLPNMDAEMKKLLVEAISYHEGRLHFICRIKNIPFWMKHYKYMFIGFPRYSFILQFIKYLFWG